MPDDAPKRRHVFDIIVGRMTAPRVAITVGDPAGIGPEIATKAARDERVLAACEPVIFENEHESNVATGRPSAESGRAAYDVTAQAVGAAGRGEADAIPTAPVSKLAFAQAGLPWKGHTDLLAHLCGTERYAMLFYSPNLVVTLATIHIPLSEVASALTTDGVVEKIELTAEWLRQFGVARPRLAVAGVNPHAGEAGVLGREDDAVMAPAVARTRVSGIDVTGPWPGDTVFLRASRGEFDAVVAAYHDQGLIPVKLLAFGNAVNVTVGLPIIRTSVDHGTAFDIAGSGKADPASLIEAVLLAARLSSIRVRTA